MRPTLLSTGSALAMTAVLSLVCQPTLAIGANPGDVLNLTGGPQSVEAVNALNIDQTARGSQEVLNLAIGSSLDGVAQDAVNTLNVISADGRTLNMVMQDAAGAQQRVLNMQQASSGPLLNGSQTGQNVANVVTARNVNTVTQGFHSGSRQEVVNRAYAATEVVNFSQTAQNVINVADVSGVANVVDQRFPGDSSQTARNVLDSDGTDGVVDTVEQRATNIANFVQASDVGLIDRTAFGTQRAENLLEFSAGSLSNVLQSASNIANLAEVDGFGRIVQTASGEQIIVNRITATDPGMSGNVSNVVQNSSNVANLTLVSPAPGAQGSIDQSADVDTHITNEINTLGTQMNVMQTGAGNSANMVIVE